MIKLFASAYFCVAFMAAWIMVFRYPKSEKIRNGVTDMVLSYLTLLCFGVIPAGLFSLVGIPVQLWSMGTVYLLSAAVLFYWMRKKNQKQSYKWELYDIVAVLLLLVITVLITLRFFTSELELRYWTSDAAVHLKYALNTYRNSEVSQMYFAPLYGSTIIGILSPFLGEASLYKGFLIGDMSLFFLSAVLFFVLIRDRLKSVWMKAVGFVVCVLYLFGYPLYSYIHTFLYWGIGVMLIGYLMYTAHMYLKDEIEEKIAVFMLFVGCAGLILSYALFAPPVFFAVFCCLVKKAAQRGRLFTGSNVLLALKIFLLPCLLGIYYCYIELLIGSAGSLSAAIATEGAIHQEWYMDFILLLPLALFWIIRRIRERKFDEEIVFFLLFAGYLLVMFVAVYKGMASGYYYYKLYYPLWLFFWLFNLRAFGWLWKQLKELAISIGLIAAGLLLFCFSGIEHRLSERVGVIVAESRSDSFFQLYLDNAEYLKRDWADFELYEYMMELVEYAGIQEDECIPFICGDDQYAYCYWYEALSGHNSLNYYGWFHPVEEMETLWKNGGIRQAIVWKPSTYYQENKAYFKQFEAVFENGQAIVIDVDAEEEK